MITTVNTFYFSHCFCLTVMFVANCRLQVPDHCLLSYYRESSVIYFTVSIHWRKGPRPLECPYSSIHLSSAAPAIFCPYGEPAALTYYDQWENPHKRADEETEYPPLQHAPWHQCLCGRMEKHQKERLLESQSRIRLSGKGMQPFWARVEGRNL